MGNAQTPCYSEDIHKLVARQPDERIGPKLIEYKITISQLEIQLWESANLMRGLMDAVDFDVIEDIKIASALFETPTE